MKRILSIVLCLALVLGVIAGCGNSANAPKEIDSSNGASEGEKQSDEDKKLKVGFIVGSREHVFYNIIEESIKNKAKEIGIEALTYDGELDANVQSDHIDNLVAMGVDAIALATVDAAGVGPAIEKADAAGIPVFTFDSGCDTVNVIKCHVGTDNVEGGRLGAKEALRLVKAGGTVAMIGNPASAAVLDRQKGFEEVIKAQKDVEYKFFGNYEGDANVAASLMQDWLAAEPNLGAVFCAGDPAATGALSAIKAAGADTLVIGFDGNPEANTAIYDKDGDGKQWVSEISQNPKLIGEKITEQIHSYLTKGTVEAEKIPIDPYIITYDYIVEHNLMKK